MAAGGYKEFVAGETLDQDEINDYLMQGMLVFAGTAARGSAIGTPVEGQFSFLTDSDTVEYYDGSAWTALSTSPGAAVVSGTTGSPTVGTVSSGGTTYNVYSFTGSGSITFSEAGFAELLMIGGGGGGGDGYGGGGGAGGFLDVTSAYFAAGTSTVVVGAGGAAGIPTGNEGAPGNNGQISRIGDFYSPGGGGGASWSRTSANTVPALDGLNGASGGGAGGFNIGAIKSGGLAIAPLGNVGGDSANAAGGGGGGADAAGSNATTNYGGNGGNGSASSITGSSVTYSGGGGGGALVAGSGGSGGGGAGSNSGSATGGSANTGAGGGGTSTGTSAAGGSGIVIVRVAV